MLVSVMNKITVRRGGTEENFGLLEEFFISALCADEHVRAH